MSRTSVSVLSHDLSHNCLGRAQVIAALLAAEHDVEIVGPARSGKVWGPLAGAPDLALRPLPADAGVGTIAAAADGDVLFAVKPRTASLGAALAARRRRDRPVIADVDDWEMAFFYDQPRWAVRNLLPPTAPDGVLRTWIAERRVRQADAVTVSSTWLQRRFGGLVVPHARADQEASRSRAEVRADWGAAPDDFLVVFLGSVRPHKIATTVAAMDRLGPGSRAKLVVIDPEGYVPRRPYVLSVPAVPFGSVQQMLRGADAVVLAQADSRTGRAQMPAKVFDAMAAGVPVVASDVSDLRQVLDGVGVLVAPESPGAVAGALRELMADPAAARATGARARARFEERYRLDAVAPGVTALVRGLLEGHRLEPVRS